MRSLVEWLARLILKIFFRRIEIIGRDNVPVDGPIILAINHPNGLIDPLCVLAHAPRKLSFLAKEPLFRMPLIKYLVKAFDCLPVYRKQDGNQDGANQQQNLSTLQAAGDLLTRGGAIALFPEGISHDLPQLQSLKTGAARIALGAQSLMASDDQNQPAVHLIPAGLYYSSKGIFRSDVTLVYGAPLPVPVVSLDDTASPPPEAVNTLTQHLFHHLQALTVNAQDSELISLAAIAARLIDTKTATFTKKPNSNIAQRRLQLMQQILNGHEQLQTTNPEQAIQLVQRLRRYDALTRHYGLPPKETVRPDTGPAIKHSVMSTVMLILLSPLIVPGVLENYLTYRLVGRMARSYTEVTHDTLSTLKVIAGMIAFPLTWIIWSLLIGWFTTLSLAFLHLALAPICAWAALLFMDRSAATLSGARVLWMYWTQPNRYAQLNREGHEIAEQLMSIELDPKASE